MLLRLKLTFCFLFIHMLTMHTFSCSEVYQFRHICIWLSGDIRRHSSEHLIIFHFLMLLYNLRILVEVIHYDTSKDFAQSKNYSIDSQCLFYLISALMKVMSCVLFKTLQAARGGHSAALIGSRLIVFGGEDKQRRLLNDIHILDLETMTWERVEAM